MAIGNVELVHESFPIHSSMGTARMIDKETDKDKKRGVIIERSKASTKKTAYHYVIKIQQ